MVITRLALAVLFVLSASRAPGQEAGAAAAFDQAAARAIELHQAGDILGAIDAYLAALQIEPNHPGVRTNLGAAYVKLGQFDQAIEQYNAVLRIDPANPTVRFNLGLAYYKAARHEEASKEFEAVAAVQPENTAAVLLLGDSLLQLGYFGRVVELLTPREAQFETDLAFGYVLGTALLRTGERDRAQVYLDRIFKAGESAEAHLLMATALLETRDYPGALTELRKAIQLNPELPTLHTTYARALLGAGDHEGAVRELRRALTVNPNDFDANLQLGALLRRDERHDESARYLRRAVELRPHDPAARFGLAGALLSLGDVDGSRTLLEGVVKDVPQYTEAHVMLATCYYRLKRRADGDRHRAIAEELRQQEQERQPRPGTSGP